MKTYLLRDVYDAAIERLEFVYSQFDRVYLSFSGGKDSGVMLELALEVARRRGRLPLDVVLIDLEAHYQEHVEYALRACDRPEIRACWACLPLSLRNAVSQFQPKWVCWDESERAAWVRPMPDRPYVVHQGNMPAEWASWVRRGMEFEEFIIYYADWCAAGAERTACVVAIRADESLNRYRTIVSSKKERYADRGWTTRVQDCRLPVWNCYPLYDWRVEDVWTYVARTGCDYNHVYDRMYQMGRGVHEMRICQPYGDDQRRGLDMFQECEPEVWARVVQRVAGANFGALYRGGTILGNLKADLPPGHTWESYAGHLLRTMPPYLRDHYVRRINVFLKWWARELGQEIKSIQKRSPGEAFDELGVFVYQIPDSPRPEYEEKYTRHGGPSWRRIAKVLVANDYYCKALSFGQNKQEFEKLEALRAKYSDL